MPFALSPLPLDLCPLHACKVCPFTAIFTTLHSMCAGGCDEIDESGAAGASEASPPGYNNYMYPIQCLVIYQMLAHPLSM